MPTYTVRLRLRDPAGRYPTFVEVEQRIGLGYKSLGRIAPEKAGSAALSLRVETEETGDVVHHLRVTAYWSDGLISVADELFVSEDKKFWIRPDKDIAPNPTYAGSQHMPTMAPSFLPQTASVRLLGPHANIGWVEVAVGYALGLASGGFAMAKILRTRR